MILSPIKQGSNQYCGPAVISSITGKSTDEIARMVQQLRGKARPVSVMYSSEIRAILEQCGYVCYDLILTKGTSIFYLLQTRKFLPGIYLFYVPGHVVVLEFTSEGLSYIVDNHTKSPLTLSASSRLTQRVLSFVKVEKKENKNTQK